MRAGMQVEHEVDQRALQPCSRSPVHRKACAGKLRGTLQIENPQRFANLPVRLWLEGKLRRRSPALDLDIVLLRLAHRNRIVWKIRKARKNSTQFVFGLVRGSFKRL